MPSHKSTYSGHSLKVKLRNGRRLVLNFGEKAEVICFAQSPDGNFVIYNLQQYKPNIYELVLHNLIENKEEWRYRYPKNQVIHELDFKGPRILVYSGPRPSAFVDRRYNFTLDLTGKLVENDVVEEQKQKERDDAQDRVKQIFTLNLVDVAPTMEIWVSPRSQAEKRASNSAWVRIMKGHYPLPVLYAMIQHGIEESHFFVNVFIFARTPEELVKTATKCLVTLNKKKEEFRKNRLVILNEPQASDVPSFRGSGPFFGPIHVS
jgi:hypothetical protein